VTAPILSVQVQTTPPAAVDSAVDQDELRRRVRAARAYAGMSLDRMAAALGVGRQTLVRIERGERKPKRMELREMAAISGLPVEFFSADFRLLAAPGEADSALGTVAVSALHELRDDIDRLLRAAEGSGE
jgi:transcriptional regulator with XRE-family HTH domain